ncbi:50S ribosomal protein L25 [Aminipila luticellarii]|uniref:Large ribosomal subunit protein bL25 n=1 Tax=Aminipila luticellarii TaxID=2507160 RepID=A0A410PVG3_9FIRM|nr:50S ribosomal protein L25 [Aminipila luticellarii]QAT42856.1 50S ribosomal protein L25 [Aminipila luticellarii]
MKDAAIIKIEKRDQCGSNANRRLRKTGYLPGNIFSKGTESIAIQVNKSELRKKISELGRNAVFTLDMSGEKNNLSAIIKEIQISPRGEVLHVDFQQVSLSQEIKTDVIVKIVGEEALEAQKLILTHQMDSVSVKGLPQDIPESIDIDVSKLHAGSVITVGDITLPKGIISENSPEHIILTINQSKIRTTDDEGDEDIA